MDNCINKLTYFWMNYFVASAKLNLHNMRSLDLSSLGKKSLICMDLFGIILIDLSKIYDCSPHNPLIAKLEAYGLEKKIPTDTPHQINVDFRWILCRYVKDQISTNFHVVSTYFFWCNFDGPKIHVVSTYFFRCNFNGRKIHVVSTYFFYVTLMVQKSTSFPRTFFGVISLVEKSTLFSLIFIDVILMVEKSSLFACTFLHEISTGRNSMS